MGASRRCWSAIGGAAARTGVGGPGRAERWAEPRRDAGGSAGAGTRGAGVGAKAGGARAQRGGGVRAEEGRPQQT
jgi:hypothetical protein